MHGGADREPDAHLRDAAYVRNRVLQAVAHWIGVANAHGGSHGRAPVPLPATRFDLLGAKAGTAHSPRHGAAFIRINMDLLTRYPRATIQETVPHEVAHIVQRAWWKQTKPHGKEWAAVMQMFGKQPSRTHSLQVQYAGGTFVYRCACRDIRVSSRRHRTIQSRPAAFRCRRCSAGVQFVGPA
ncbi:SprT family protein [Sinimarinibacterium sp. CAU 1509]|uniref:SprT family zinc-dependent metalloprotease n=1 Tax=Sinimarinibacterium sp. CAU 1509 TaxID=2562283 RepID=UPI0010AC38D3|nr:SprT-like domain-containing protein [Sinimarinibacterium sp. CAU 1509]TJY57220.1 SprT family protein [Sinimarinibacterium sp. CAU 1509]